MSHPWGGKMGYFITASFWRSRCELMPENLIAVQSKIARPGIKWRIFHVFTRG